MIRSDHILARTLAKTAGDLLLDLRQQLTDHSGRDRGRAGDLAAHRMLLQQIAAERPSDTVLSEEGECDGARFRVERLWIIDPLDGTREYGEADRDDWAVHVALWQRGHLVAGAVAIPARQLTFATDEPPAIPAARRVDNRLLIAVSRTRPPALLEPLASILPIRLVPLGSAGVKAMAVLTGEVDAYIHAGGQYEWDSAAPVAVATASGAHASRLDGSRLIYNKRDLLLPDLLVCRSELRDTLLKAIASSQAELAPVAHMPR